MIKQANISAIFPTPIYQNNLGRAFTDSEKSVLFNETEPTVLNYFNKTSVDTYVLNRPELKDINTYLHVCLEDYIRIIVNPNTTVTPHITQSWLNYTTEGGSHHKHQHQNSYLSGVLYINTDQTDKISFEKPGYEYIRLEQKEFNIFNSSSWSFDVRNMDIIIFPSHMTHYVEAVSTSHTRISLAFNSYIKGEIGGTRELTRLVL